MPPSPPDLGVITLLSHTGAITRGLSEAVSMQKSIRLSLAGGAAVEALPLLLAVFTGCWLVRECVEGRPPRVPAFLLYIKGDICKCE